MSIRILLADDQTLVRSGFRVLLERTDDFEVVGEASTGADAVDQVRAGRPDVSRILLKLAARDRAQLVVMAYESGLVKAARESRPLPSAPRPRTAGDVPNVIVSDANTH